MNENPLHYVRREVVAIGRTPEGADLRAQGTLDGFEVATIGGVAALTLYLRVERGDTKTITRPRFTLSSAMLFDPGDEPQVEDDEEPAIEYDDEGVQIEGRPLFKSYRPGGVLGPRRSAAEYKRGVLGGRHDCEPVEVEFVGLDRLPEQAREGMIRSFSIDAIDATDDAAGQWPDDADLRAAHEPEWMQDDGGEL